MIFWIFLLHLLLEFYSKKKLWLIKYCDYLFPIKHGFIEKQNQRKYKQGIFSRFCYLKFWRIKVAKTVSRFLFLYFTYGGHALLKYSYWKRFIGLIF